MRKAAGCQLVFEKSTWTLPQAAMILSVVKNPVLERRQRLRIGIDG
jgi:hypothetical protein